jgi:hypothetical protein
LRGRWGEESWRREQDPVLEETRDAILEQAADRDATIEVFRVKSQLFGSLEQGPGGSMLAGTLNKARREVHSDVIMRMLPWVEWPRDEDEEGKEQKVAVDINKEREQALAQYHRWVQGGTVEATILEHGEAAS